MSGKTYPCDTCTLPDCNMFSRNCNMKRAFNRRKSMLLRGEKVPVPLNQAANEYRRNWKAEHFANVSEGLK